MEKIITAAVKEYVSVFNRILIDEIIDCSYELTEQDANFMINNYISVEPEFCQITICNNNSDRVISGKALYEALDNLSGGCIFEDMSMNINFKSDRFRAIVTLNKDVLLKWYYTTIK